MANRGPDNLSGRFLRGENVYHLQDKLGGGGNGDVYLATRRRDKRRFAVKVIHEETDPQSIAMLWKEARTMERLSHPNIIKLEEIDVDRRDGLSYLVMPVASEGSLRRVAPLGTILTPDVITPLLVNVAEGLQYAHDHKIIHRDVKPDNILLNRDSSLQTWVSDFGIASLTHTLSSLPTDPLVTGTVPYMSLEALSGHLHLQQDQYALAVIAYKYLTGKFPYEGKNSPQIVYAMLNNPLRTFSQQGVVMNDELKAVEPVVRRGLAKDVAARYPTVRAFALDFQEQLAEGTEAARTAKARKYFEVGIDLQGKGEFNKALKAFDQGIQLNPKIADAFYDKGVVLDNLGRYEEAIQAYDQAIRLNPKHAAAYTNKGAGLWELGRHEEAIKLFDQAIRLNPKHAAAFNNKGVYLRELGRHEEAIQVYDQAIRLDPKNVDAFNNKGIALSELGRHEESIKLYDQAIRVDPKDAYAYYNKGIALRKLGRYEKAIKSYDQAIRINPKLAYAYYNKGIALSELGRHEEAERAFQKAEDLEAEQQ